MKNKSITIEAPEGHVIDEFNKATGVVTFKLEPKDIMERIQTFQDVCADQNRDPSDYICESDDPDEIMANATKMLLLIVRCFNEGKEADWSNSNQSKYFPWWQYSPSSGWSLHDVDYWLASTLCGARLAFLNRKHAEYCASKFKYVYDNINNQITN